jgi:hypothetical protein
MTRLFTFGCSFTNYRWSTWADCLAPEFDYFENWAQSGAGNHYIFNSVMEADQQHKFTAGDTVVVCWSGINREDRYIDGRWHTPGNVHFAKTVYHPEYLMHYVDDRGFLIRDLAYIKAVKRLLESCSINWRFLSMSELVPQNSLYKDAVDLYQDVLDSIAPGFDKTVFLNNWPKASDDPHPSPAEHLAYLDTVLPGWVTKKETRVKMYNESINLNKDPKRSGIAKVTRL